MKITTVTVEIHEKRNHPHEYGHRDAQVAYTADLDEGEEADAAVVQLQLQARQRVEAELDRWIAEVEQQRTWETARSQLGYMVSRAEGDDIDVAEFARHLLNLPEGEREEYQTNLAAAQAKYNKALRDELSRLIERAEKDIRPPGSWEESRFDLFVNKLPEEEQEGYRLQMATALAARSDAP